MRARSIGILCPFFCAYKTLLSDLVVSHPLRRAELASAGEDRTHKVDIKWHSTSLFPRTFDEGAQDSAASRRVQRPMGRGARADGARARVRPRGLRLIARIVSRGVFLARLILSGWCPPFCPARAIGTKSSCWSRGWRCFESEPCLCAPVSHGTAGSRTKFACCLAWPLSPVRPEDLLRTSRRARRDRSLAPAEPERAGGAAWSRLRCCWTGRLGFRARRHQDLWCRRATGPTAASRRAHGDEPGPRACSDVDARAEGTVRAA